MMRRCKLTSNSRPRAALPVIKQRITLTLKYHNVDSCHKCCAISSHASANVQPSRFTAQLSEQDFMHYIPAKSLQRQPASCIEKAAGPSVVCVTGATGYLGSRVVHRLLEQGHTVHAICLPLELDSNNPVIAHLQSHPGASERLKLFPGDVLQPSTLASAMQGTSHLLHMAAFVKLTSTRKEQQLMMDIAVEGTKNLLSALNTSKSGIKKVVMLSSVAAIVADNYERGKHHTYTVNDWAQDCKVGHNTYSFAKRISERLAYRIASQQDRWQLATINPGVVFGPVSCIAHAATSPGMVVEIMTQGGLSLDLTSVFADVDDVAAAACTALFGEDISGRHIVGNQMTGVHAIHAHLKSALPAWQPTAMSRPPGWVMSPAAGLANLVTGMDLSVLPSTVYKPIKIDLDTSRNQLQIPQWIDWHTTLCDTVLSLSSLGLINVEYPGQGAVQNGKARDTVPATTQQTLTS